MWDGAGISNSSSACSLRSGYSTKDYSLTGFVWSTVNLSSEHLGHGISLKVTVVCDSVQEPLTFTCDCKSLLGWSVWCYADPVSTCEHGILMWRETHTSAGPHSNEGAKMAAISS